MVRRSARMANKNANVRSTNQEQPKQEQHNSSQGNTDPNLLAASSQGNMDPNPLAASSQGNMDPNLLAASSQGNMGPNLLAVSIQGNMDPNLLAAVNQAVATILPQIVANLMQTVHQKQSIQEEQGNDDNIVGLDNQTMDNDRGAQPGTAMYVWLERFQKQRPLSFSSAQTPVDVENWIMHMDKIFDVLGCSNNQKVRLAAYKLEGDAQRWWRTLKLANGGDAYVEALTWNQFCEVFYHQYFSAADKEAYAQEYSSIRQKEDESVTDYLARFVRLANFVGSAAGTEIDQAEKFKRTVHYRYCSNLINEKFTNVAHAANAAKNIEMEQLDFQAARPKSSKNRNRTCYLCRQVGHFARDCTDPIKDGRGGNRCNNGNDDAGGDQAAEAPGRSDLQELNLKECKAYLREHELRLSGTKEEYIQRIKEHSRIKDGKGQALYPRSSFTINCTGDACKGDVVLFTQNIYKKFGKVKRSESVLGKRSVAGRIVKDSYAAAKQRHTFTIEVLWSKGFQKLPPLSSLLVRGCDLYRFKTLRQRWRNEAERSKVLAEKHKRGAAARHKLATKKIRMDEGKKRQTLSHKEPSTMKQPIQQNKQKCAKKDGAASVTNANTSTAQKRKGVEIENTESKRAKSNSHPSTYIQPQEASSSLPYDMFSSSSLIHSWPPTHWFPNYSHYNYQQPGVSHLPHGPFGYGPPQFFH